MIKRVLLYSFFCVCVLSALVCVYFMTYGQQLTPRLKAAESLGKLITPIQKETTLGKYHRKWKTRMGLQNGNRSLKTDDISLSKTGDREKRKQLALRSNSQRTLSNLMKRSNQMKSTYKIDDHEKITYKIDDPEKDTYKIDDPEKDTHKIDDPEKSTYKIDDPEKNTYKIDDPEKNGNHSLKKDQISQIETDAEKKWTHFLGLERIWGRLGNHMFYYASLRGIADAINYTPILSRTDPILELFEINLNKSVSTLTLNNNVTKSEKCTGIFTEDLISPINTTTNITVLGYLQSFKYFQNIESDIRKEFILKADIKARVKHIFNTFNITHRIKVGVHARRGDFVRLQREGYKLPTPLFFYKAMDMLRQNLTNPIFVMCSDDKKWVTDYLQFNNSVIVHESEEVDFGVLMSCDHSIISSGTFSWWTAYLTKGASIYFKGFPSTRLLGCISPSDYYPSHWIALE
ncbi:galactoside 2-alpha-L-fucosyltransferase Sec1-like [Patella vulgata]|uniref:galactoside 2-alpha-L-fucosyltransferase Sec1-like n=1 Tax=Patella vulgata TaxID=6465 RepID=UPI002180556D|nr:galactoside 2-alpha-L-fucosyltransferase Sec1-like [Patella vulgata]